MSQNDGGPAFPVIPPLDPGGGSAIGYPFPAPGMFLRDYFAAAALVGIASQRGGYPSEWARLCYQVADAMLKECEKGGGA